MNNINFIGVLQGRKNLHLFRFLLKFNRRGYKKTKKNTLVPILLLSAAKAVIQASQPIEIDRFNTTESYNLFQPNFEPDKKGANPAEVYVALFDNEV